MGRKIFAVFVAALFIYIVWPLLLPVVMGGILAVLFIPLLERCEKFRLPKSLAAAMLTLAVSILVLVPIAGLIFFGAKSGFQQLQAFRHAPANPGSPISGDWIDALIDTPRFHIVLEWVARYFPASVHSLADSAHTLVQDIVARIGNLLGQLISALPGLVMALFVTTLSLFFFLVDGRKLVLYFRRISFFTPQQTEQLLHTLAGMCRSVILASVVSGAVQGVVMLVGAISLGLPNPAVLASAVFVGSFVPVIGSAPVTLGLAIHQFFVIGPGHGFAMLAVAIIVGTIDNVVRPMFLKGSANLHPLVAFIAAFGGLQTFGFLGVFLGPIVAGLLIATVQILKDEPTRIGVAI